MEYIYVLEVGGSNAKCRGSGGLDPIFASSLIEVWNNQSETPTVGTNWISSPTFNNAPWDPISNGNNSGLWFCDRLAKHTRKNVRLLVAAKGNLLMNDIQPPSGPRYTLVKDAYSVSSAPPADILIWNNGDELLSTNYDMYKALFQNMLNGFIADNIIKPSTVIILQGLVGTQAYLNTNIQTLSSEIANSYFASSNSLRDFDGVHLNGPDLYYMGYNRCWEAYQQSTGPLVRFGKADFL